MASRPMQKAEKLRKLWEKEKARTLKLKNRPDADLCAEGLLFEKERF